MKSTFDGLPVFVSAGGVPKGIDNALVAPFIKKVVCCALGPEGTNIQQAAVRFAARLEITDKTEVVLRNTPEACLELARSINEDGVIAVFWTCAVYAREKEFFFGNPDVFPFFFQESMPLDNMQLSAKPETVSLLTGAACKKIPPTWNVASHPSPAPLIAGLGLCVRLQNSNAAAAEACAKGEAELCITTEAARKIHGLVKIHEFGSPLMVFFGGVTQHGREQAMRAYSSIIG